jgi:plasmid maintenance system antidote protein VapI
MTTQLGIPSVPRPEEIARKQTLGAAIELCAELAGHSLDKTLQQRLDVDKAQFSRWQSGTEGIVWPKFTRLMDVCGNDAPLMWMLHQRGYDLHSLRKQESETERELRLAREELDAERLKVRVLTDALHGRVAH